MSYLLIYLSIYLISYLQTKCRFYHSWNKTQTLYQILSNIKNEFASLDDETISNEAF